MQMVVQISEYSGKNLQTRHTHNMASHRGRFRQRTAAGLPGSYRIDSMHTPALDNTELKFTN